MDTTTQTAAEDAKTAAEKPGWGATALLSGGFFLSVRLGGTEGWWTALWVPLLILTLCAMYYEWTLLVRARFRMSLWEWPTMITCHITVPFGLALAVGLIRI
ncbi:hypothetical protein [Streptomyces sp. NPDC002990]